MKFRLITTKFFFLPDPGGFCCYDLRRMAAVNSAYKGKEKDFNDKLFLVAPFIEGNTGKRYGCDECRLTE
jgi:hypothetical protein